MYYGILVHPSRIIDVVSFFLTFKDLTFDLIVASRKDQLWLCYAGYLGHRYRISSCLQVINLHSPLREPGLLLVAPIMKLQVYLISTK